MDAVRAINRLVITEIVDLFLAAFSGSSKRMQILIQCETKFEL
jgi:hypothetical protein